MDPNALLLFSILAVTSVDPSRAGQTEALRAYYKYTGLETSLNKFERERVPEELRAWLGPAAFVSQTVINRRITFRISFP